MGEDIRAQAGKLKITAGIILVWASSMILVPFLIQVIVDEAIPRRDFRLLAIQVIWVVAALCLATLALYFQGRFGVRACEDMMLGLRRRLMEKVLSQAWDLSNRFGSSDLVARFTQDTEHVAESLYEILVRSIMGTIYPAMLLVYLLVWNWRFGLIAAAVLPGYALYYMASQRVISRMSKPSKEALARQTAVCLDLVDGATEIRVFQQAEISRRRFARASGAYSGAAIQTKRMLDASRTWMDMLGLAISYSPIIIGGFLIVGGNASLTVGMLLACFSHLRLLTMRLTLIFYGVAGFAVMQPSLVRLQEILEYPLPPARPIIGVGETPQDTSVEFVDVGFSHPDGRVIFKGLNLKIGQGEKVAIMGPSGSGKSTLLQLLLCLRTPTSGRILLGGRDIASYPLPFYLSFFSYVEQKTHLFHLSVSENVSMGWYNIPEEIIRDAVDKVHMHEAVARLPQGYATILGERGVNLSGGQAQRLALARAMIRDPAILVLDEFTSAMDRTVEEEIIEDLFAISTTRTLICVTHSIAVASRFDRIISLEAP